MMRRLSATSRALLKVLVPTMAVSAISTSTSPCSSLTPLETRKLMAGAESVDRFVDSGTVVGIGDGTTTSFVIQRLHDKLQDGSLSNIVILPFTDQVRRACISLNLPIVEWNWSDKTDPPSIDLVICGIDEMDVKFNMIKGANGTLARERVATTKAKRVVVVCDDSKLSKNLGPGVPLPVEIDPSNFERTRQVLENLPSIKGCRAYIRTGTVNNITHDGCFKAVTDNGNFIVDLYFSVPIKDPAQTQMEISRTKGVYSHGLFVNDPSQEVTVIVGSRKGVEIFTNNSLPNHWWNEIRHVL